MTAAFTFFVYISEVFWAAIGTSACVEEERIGTLTTVISSVAYITIGRAGAASVSVFEISFGAFNDAFAFKDKEFAVAEFAAVWIGGVAFIAAGDFTGNTVISYNQVRLEASDTFFVEIVVEVIVTVKAFRLIACFTVGRTFGTSFHFLSVSHRTFFDAEAFP